MRPRYIRAAAVCVLTLIATANFAFAGTPNEPRLDPNVAPTHESIELNLDSNQDNYNGSVKIQLHVTKATREFLFHAEEMKLDKVELTGTGGAIPVTVAEAGDRGTQKATAQKDIAPGDYTFSIAFSKPYNTKAVGLY